VALFLFYFFGARQVKISAPGPAYKLNQTFSIKFAKVCFPNMCFYARRPRTVDTSVFRKRDCPAPPRGTADGRRRAARRVTRGRSSGAHKSEYSFSYPLIRRLRYVRVRCSRVHAYPVAIN